MKVWLDESAVNVLKMVRNLKGEPYITIVEDGCCAFSGIFVRLDRPENGFVPVGESEGFKVYMRDSLFPLYKDHVLGITALQRVDDSFSAETEFGYKLTIFYHPEERDYD